MEEVLTRLRVRHGGAAAASPLLFVHSYYADQSAWRLIAPAFEHDHHIVLYDALGRDAPLHSGGADQKYATLSGHAEDLLEVCRALNLTSVTLMSRSAGAMVGLLAVTVEPQRFARLILIDGSPRYLDDGAYRGGFARAAIDELLHAIDSNHLGWSSDTASQVSADPETPACPGERAEVLTTPNPRTALQFGKAVFLGDYRHALTKVTIPTLILQHRSDPLVPQHIGEYLHRHITGSRFELLDAADDLPPPAASRQTIAAIHRFLDDTPVSARR